MNTGELERIRAFVRAVDAGSFTAVASENGASQPTVSRQIGALEAQLGARLFHRTTRTLALTEEGRTYYAHARAVLEAAEAAAASLADSRDQVTGLLRIACPLAFARLQVLPRLGGFLAAYPALRTDFLLNDRAVDLVEEGIDVAIRFGRVEDRGLAAPRLGLSRRVTVASPAYLASRLPPAHPTELSVHDCIVFTALAAIDEWHFADPAGPAPIRVRVSGRVRVNASDAVRAAVLAGLGVASVPAWLLRDELETGRLLPLLEAFEPAPVPIQAVFVARRLVPPRVRAFVDFLAAEFRADPRLAPR